MKSLMRRPKIWQPESHVRSNNSNQSHAVDVMPLRNHLRPNQHVERAFIQRIQSVLEILATANRIAIKPANPSLRKHSMQQFFELLRSRPGKIYIFTAAKRALIGNALNVPAVMAFHLMFPLVV